MASFKFQTTSLKLRVPSPHWIDKRLAGPQKQPGHFGERKRSYAFQESNCDFSVIQPIT
jgi:hypothetical protein